MLLAVEGGRFFSSSATGYSNGLNLILLGHKKEGKPMRVSPWNQYHLVDQVTDPNLQLAANNNRCTCGCASFTCFGRAATGLESPSGRQDVKTTSQLKKVEENSRALEFVEGDGNSNSNSNGISLRSLKSSLKRRVATVAVSVAVSNSDDVESVYQSARRSVNWTDVTGGELCEVREFEPSEHSDSDDEFENGATRKTCSCRIM